MSQARQHKRETEVDALLVIFNAEGRAIGTVPIRVPALSDDDRRLALQSAGKLQLLGGE